MLRNRNRNIHRMFQESWKEKFHKVKNPEVVRCEIEKSKKMVPTPFPYDTVKIAEKSEHFAKSEEECRQRWHHLFMYSDHDYIITLRQKFILSWVQNAEVAKIGARDASRNIRRRLKKLIDEINFNNFGMDEYELLERLLEEEYVKGIELETILHSGPGDAEKEFEWIRGLFARIAIRIATIGRKISENIHNSKFENKNEVPAVYNILDEPEYEWCIQALMCHHSADDFPEENENGCGREL